MYSLRVVLRCYRLMVEDCKSSRIDRKFQVMSVMFLDRFPLKYGRFVCMACREVVFRYLTTTGRPFLTDKTVTVLDNIQSVTNNP